MKRANFLRGHLRTTICNPMIVGNDYEMVQKIFDLLAKYGNPCKRDEVSLDPHHRSNEYQINVEDATLYVNGSVYFSFPDF